ncbi:MAG: DNA helicase RecQ [Oscillospiraceae bacterium]|nr:DNA helicase RecQ [Oscillospiraceae bacterium]
MTPQSVLKKYYGYDAFRGGQEALIGGILAGRDVLGIMPTGAGKSVCFQIPALMMDGLTLIVSPLISLMKDQVNALTQAGIPAAFINSSLTDRQVAKALQNARNGAYKMIYIAPERLFAYDFLSFAQSADIAMIAVDEAHCLSQWGHDFRPSYTRIPEFIANLDRRPVLSAFTATATPRVREDIIHLLQLQNPTVLGTGFDRPNLYFEVQKPKNKMEALLAFLENKKDRGGIVYCATRKAVEEVCDSLKESGYSASRYHAGLTDRERHDNQEDFIYDRVQVMVATNAFGMGIDKSNVSFVAHYNMPKDIESYYQEAGRAGRDGEPADCVLLYSGQDVRTNLWLIENARETEEEEDQALREQLMERDRAKLREMTFYCATTDCLRGYILHYFGETPPAGCGNCGSCVSGAEATDVTVMAQKILSCVVRMRERYGINTIIETLRGSKSEKILNYGLDKLSVYGICAESERQLRAVIGHLILSGYLVKTDDKYPIVLLGKRSGEILRDRAAVYMKLPKEKEPLPTKQKTQPQPARPVDKQLFDALRQLRREIADELSVPAFVVFPDSTLTDMCIKLPATGEQLLNVSGVGQVKAQRHGKRFLEAIAAYLADHDIPETPAEPRAFDPSLIEITDEPVTVTVIAERINCALLEAGRPKISGVKINDWLVSKELLTVVTADEKNQKLPAPAGEALGITAEERMVRGQQMKINVFDRRAQEFIIRNILEFI